MEPAGTIVFASVGVTSFGFDVFSVAAPSPASAEAAVSAEELDERRHTDGVSVNFNAQFADDDGDAVAFVSERTGAAALFLSRPGSPERPEPLPAAAEGSLFHDRPTVGGGRVFFVSAHENPDQPFRSWAAVYAAGLGGEGKAERLTPRGVVDMSPAVSASGDLLAVASYGDRPWAFDFRVLETEVAVFRAADPARRGVVAARGGWPAWHGDAALLFHRVADDGWWSVFRVGVSPETLQPTGPERRVTPPGLHCFTPAAPARGGRWIAVATRRKGRAQRHVELFDLETERFAPLTELLNPGLHHYNPFFTPSGGRVGYHRFRGAGAPGDSAVPYLQPVRSPVPSIRMLRVNGTFPSFSPDAAHLAVNGDLEQSPGVMVLRSDGSRRWTLSKEPTLFYTAWSPTERGVLFTSAGPIFETTKATVRIARVEFDPAELTDDRGEVGAAVRAMTRPEAGNDAFPAVSPCGRWVVFRSGRTGHKNLYVMDAARGEEGGGVRRLTDGEWIDTMPSWSPDGTLIAFSSNRHDPANPAVFSIYLVRPDGSGLRRVYVAGAEGSAAADRERINHVCFSPDSEWLLFTANLGGVMAEPIAGPNQFQPYGDLYVCRLDGSGLRRLTCNAYENGTPAWGPASAGLGLESLTMGPLAGEDPLGKFVEPLWLTCDV